MTITTEEENNIALEEIDILMDWDICDKHITRLSELVLAVEEYEDICYGNGMEQIGDINVRQRDS